MPDAQVGHSDSTWQGGLKVVPETTAAELAAQQDLGQQVRRVIVPPEARGWDDDE